MFENRKRYTLDRKLGNAYYGIRQHFIRMGLQAESIQELYDREKEIRHISDFGMQDIQMLIAGLMLNENMPYYDPEEGLKRMTELAENGHPKSMFLLGVVFYNGQRGIPQDRIMAKYWIEKAAENGYTMPENESDY